MTENSSRLQLFCIRFSVVFQSFFSHYSVIVTNSCVCVCVWMCARILFGKYGRILMSICLIFVVSDENFPVTHHSKMYSKMKITKFSIEPSTS
jgi:hypothetical protein